MLSSCEHILGKQQQNSRFSRIAYFLELLDEIHRRERETDHDQPQQ
uniref:Uncharacterized protein n=1 Tax=Aegilops tauschii subsp. strangulata TaxID=200361 RepID=A0A453SL25_AEGTS